MLRADYLKLGRPVLMRGATLANGPRSAVPSDWGDWRAAMQRDDFLAAHGGRTFLTSAIPYGDIFGTRVENMTAADYVGGWGAREGADAAGDPPVDRPYIFHSVTSAHDPLLKGFPTLFPPFLSDAAARQLVDISEPKAVQFFLGQAGSGAPIHFHCDAWNTIAHGSKRWILSPPSSAIFSKKVRKLCPLQICLSPVFSPGSCSAADTAVAVGGLPIGTRTGREQQLVCVWGMPAGGRRHHVRAVRVGPCGAQPRGYGWDGGRIQVQVHRRHLRPLACAAASRSCWSARSARRSAHGNKSRACGAEFTMDPLLALRLAPPVHSHALARRARHRDTRAVLVRRQVRKSLPAHADPLIRLSEQGPP